MSGLRRETHIRMPWITGPELLLASLVLVAITAALIAVLLHMAGFRHAHPMQTPAPLVTDVQLVTE